MIRRPDLGGGPAVVAAVAVMIVACVPRALVDADRAWEAGDWESAVAGYEAALPSATPRREERLLFRLGLAHASLTSPVHDAEKARERLSRLISRYPTGSFRQAAAVVLQLVGVADVVQRRIVGLESERAELGRRIASTEAELAVRETTLARLRAQLEEAHDELERLKHALEELKRIDLGRRP